MKLFMSIAMLLFSAMPLASAALDQKKGIVWLDVPLETDGKGPKLFWKENALKYCSDRGARLPTLREFAQYAETQGAMGIKETQYPNTPRYSEIVESEVKENYKIRSIERFGGTLEFRYRDVVKWDEQGQIFVDFYYSNSGYNGRFYLLNGFYPQAFWAAPRGSARNLDQYSREKEGAGFDISSGYPADSGFSIGAVRCVVDQK